MDGWEGMAAIFVLDSAVVLSNMLKKDLGALEGSVWWKPKTPKTYSKYYISFSESNPD